MNTNVRKLLESIKDPVERLGAWEAWIERAGVAEFDGRLSREAAEALATEELRQKLAAMQIH